MIHHHGPLFFTLTRRFPIYHLSYWQCFLNVTAWRNWGKFCIPRGYLLNLGSNPLVNQDDRARLVVVTAQRLLRKMSYTLKRTEFASDGICYFCKWRIFKLLCHPRITGCLSSFKSSSKFHYFNPSFQIFYFILPTVYLTCASKYKIYEGKT